MTTIPLLCNICPKKPVFSDVSHLLTHIASKGHLSHYYKVKVRASTDADSRRVVEAYDQWYAEWNVEDLMSDRMSMKDKKKPRMRPAVVSRASSTAPSVVATKAQRNSLNRQSITRSTPSYKPSPARGTVDPRLTENNIKYESGVTPQLQHLQHTDAQHHGFEAAYPSAYSTAYSYPNCGQLPGLSYQSDIHGPYDVRHNTVIAEDGKENIPSPYRLGAPKRQTYDNPVMISSESGARTPKSVEDEDSFDIPPNDNSKLKGVYWPGMSIFDSATPSSRRRRNQKKDTSILEQLEANSLEVEATEMVWTPEGSLKKQKPITGMVDSSSSPWKSSPIKQPRLALSELDIPRPYFGTTQLPRSSTYTNDRAENALMYEDFPETLRGRNKRKRGLQIWKDNEVEDQDDDVDGSGLIFSKRTGLNLLTRGFDHDGNNSLRRAAETDHATSPDLLDDPFVSRAQRREAGQLYPSMHGTSFNPFALPRAPSQMYCVPSLPSNGSNNVLQGATNTNQYGYGMTASANTDGQAYGYGSIFQPHLPSQQNHAQTHSRSMSWAVAYAQLDPPMAPTSMLNNAPSNINFLSNTINLPGHTLGHQSRTSQDFNSLFTAQGFWGFGALNPSPDPSLFEVTNGGDDSGNSISRQCRGQLAGQPQQNGNLTLGNFRDIDGINALTDAAELTAYHEVNANDDGLTVKVERHAVEADQKIQEEGEVSDNHDDAESVSEGRTITAPGSPN